MRLSYTAYQLAGQENTMTLLDAPAENPQKSRAMAFTVAALAFVAIVLLYFGFRYYPENELPSVSLTRWWSATSGLPINCGNRARVTV